MGEFGGSARLHRSCFFICAHLRNLRTIRRNCDGRRPGGVFASLRTEQPVEPVAARLQSQRKLAIGVNDRAKTRRFSKLGRLHVTLAPVPVSAAYPATNRANSPACRRLRLDLFGQTRKHRRSVTTALCHTHAPALLKRCSPRRGPFQRSGRPNDADHDSPPATRPRSAQPSARR